MTEMPPLMRRSRGWLVLLWVVETFFLWQYFATAEYGNEAARQLASHWRHGMSGEALLYMPGYFAMTLALWTWSQGMPLRTMIIESVIVIVLATGAAWLLVLVGVQPSIDAIGTCPPPTFDSIVRGAYTLACWILLIVCFRQARETRSIKPLLVPLIAWLTLTILRPPAEFGVLATIWTQRVLVGNLPALLSTLAIPAFVALLAARRRA